MLNRQMTEKGESLPHFLFYLIPIKLAGIKDPFTKGFKHQGVKKKNVYGIRLETLQMYHYRKYV